MSKVELVYDAGCPNLQPTRDRLRSALREEGLAAEWVEWTSDDPSLPVYARGFGSPTVFVDGVDVAPGQVDAASCRLYEQSDGTLLGIPPVAAIATALRAASRASNRR